MGLPAGPALHRGASAPENSLTGLKNNSLFFLQVHRMPYLIFLPSLLDFGYLLVETFVFCLSCVAMK